MAADVTVFDPATIRDVATFEDPMHYSVGVRYVLVNGRAVVSDGKITGERPGRALKGPGTQRLRARGSGLKRKRLTAQGSSAQECISRFRADYASLLAVQPTRRSLACPAIQPP